MIVVRCIRAFEIWIPASLPKPDLHFAINFFGEL
jgi:hypothetical protein